MIRSFRSKALRRFAETSDTSKLSVQKPDRIRRMLVRLDQATATAEMDLPGWRFHVLTGDRKGEYAIWVSENWRLTFGWSEGDAIDVDLEDYD